MNATQEVREQYKEAARQYLRYMNAKDMPRNHDFYEGRMSGLEVALSCLGVNGDEVREMYNTCEEEVRNEKGQEELGAIERPISQARVEQGAIK